MDRLSQIFTSLGDPTRRAILARLAKGQISVGELAKPFDMSLPAVSKHLTVLEKAGLIERARDGQWRRCSLKAAPLKDAHDWLSTYSRFWSESLDRLEKYLSDIQEGGSIDVPRKPKRHRRTGDR